MTKWKHKVDLDWLKARQKCLTATDIKELLPVTKTGRKRTIGNEQYLKVMSRKLVRLTDEDCISAGAAARGHILEPYAIGEFNFAEIAYRSLYHWDDVVITKEEHKPFGLAFSPDAMDEIMDYEIRRSNKRLFNGSSAKIIGEVKSYGAEKHLACGCTPPDQLEERWQIAVAMAVCSTIDDAYLIFYNPSMKEQLFIVEYNRSDLQSEIDMVLQAEQDWLDWVDTVYPALLHRNHCIIGLDDTEQEIIKEIMKKEELNPEGEKSVMT